MALRVDLIYVFILVLEVRYFLLFDYSQDGRLVVGIGGFSTDARHILLRVGERTEPICLIASLQETGKRETIIGVIMPILLPILRCRDRYIFLIAVTKLLNKNVGEVPHILVLLVLVTMDLIITVSIPLQPDKP